MRSLVIAVAMTGCVGGKQVDSPVDYAAGDVLLAHEELTLRSTSLRETRRVNIYLPPDYGASADTRYPILYMPDGGVHEDFPHLTHTIDTAIRSGEMLPVVVVGIENTQRRRDMTGPTEVAEDRAIAPEVGGSAAFRAFIRDELMPEIEGRVRGSGETAIIGESLAGLFIVETFFVEPELFDVYIAIDPSLWWNDGELAKGAAERLQAGVGPGKTLHLTSAGQRGDGNVEFVEPLVEALRAHAPEHLRWTWLPKPDQSHATIYRAAKLEILRSLFPPQ
ncbi:MAG TPA: alpha/beta hydrolase-fold protein [Enhygromyxa sp.]|nr:alpha/beta hydrolase-fold protein [Enhygromyxa sp.]